MQTVTSWGDAFITGFTNAFAIFFAAIPKVLGFLVILIIGWLIAALVARVVAGLLRTVKFNEVAERSGFSGFVHNMGVKTDSSGVIAQVAKWFIRLITLIVAFDALGLPAVSNVLQQLLLWLPNLVVALVVLVLTGLAANALGSLVRGATAQAGLGNPDLLATVTRVAVWGFGIIIAVNQLGIAATLVNTLFIGLVGALALALALAFGLGGRETAGQLVQQWYQKSQEAKPKLEKAAEAAKTQAQQSSQQRQRG
jgi:Conserved TM helix